MIEIEGRWYRAGTLSHLSLRDLLDLDVWLQQHNRSVSRWWELPELVDEIRGLPVRFQDAHPETAMLKGVKVWCTLRRAGQRLTFDEAIEVNGETLFSHEADEDDPAEDSLPHGFEAGNTQAAPDIDIEGMDLEDEVSDRILDVMHHFPSLSWSAVWDLPLFVWLGVAARIDALRSRG